MVRGYLVHVYCEEGSWTAGRYPLVMSRRSSKAAGLTVKAAHAWVT